MSLLAALVYGPEEDCDGLLTEAGRAWLRAGVKAVGVVQINAGASCDDMDMELEVLQTGQRISICQDLGSGSANACRLYPAGLAEASAALGAAMAGPVDLVIVNKFGRMEMEGAGLIAEIGQAVAAGHPLLIGVPRRFVPAWDAFAQGLDEKLPCRRAAIDAWWQRIQAPLAAE